MTGRPPALIAPAGDDAYTAAHTAVHEALAGGVHTPNPHVLSGLAVTAAAPYVQAALIGRVLAANRWRTRRYLWLQLGAASAGLLAGVGYGLFAAHSWALACIELAAFGVMLHGVQTTAAQIRAERDLAQHLLADRP